MLSLALGVAVMPSAPAFAQAPEPRAAGPSAADKETARTLFKDGDERFRAQEYDAALKAFRAADEIMGVPTTGLEYARTLMMVGRLLEARDGFIKVANSDQAPEELAAQQLARDEAGELADDLEGRIPAVRVVLTNAPDGSKMRLRIDDIEIPATAVEFARKVDPGTHTVQVFVAGFKPVSREVEVVEGEKKVLDIELEMSVVEVDLVDPWGGGARSPGDNQGVLSTLSWVGFSAGALGLLVAVPTGIFAISAKNTLEDECPRSPVCPPEKQSELDTAKTVAHVSTFGFVFAGVGIAVGVAGVLFRSSLPDVLASTGLPLTLHPYMAAGAAGVTGTF